jgi:hypothetical protein
MPDTTSLLRMMLDMSPGDRSMLEVASSDKHTDTFHLNTPPGSPNFRLWTQMVEMGWMVRLADLALPEGAPPITMTQFELTDAGKSAMPKLLADFGQYQKIHLQKMTEIFDGACLNFTKDYREQCAKSGATERDFQLMAAMTVARLITDSFAPQNCASVADNILAAAKRLIADRNRGKAN